MIRDVLVRHCNHKSSLHSELTFSKSHDQHFSIKRAIISARKKDKNKNCTLYTKDIMYKLHRKIPKTNGEKAASIPWYNIKI